MDAYNNQVTRRIAPVSNAALRAADRPAVAVARALPYAAAIAANWRLAGTVGFLFRPDGWPKSASSAGEALAVAGAGKAEALPAGFLAFVGRAKAERAALNQPLKKARTAVTLAGAASAIAVNALTAAGIGGSRTNVRKLQLTKGNKTLAEVEFSRSAGLTAFLNKADLIGSHRRGENVVSSQGDVVKPKGRNSWHRGTSVVKTPQGRRTITHLQSLKVPPQHLYFERALSDREVAGIVSGVDKPQHLKGYVGEIHEFEGLTPVWGSLKRGMITARLYHPPPGIKVKAA
jgi:hypothetical protein